MAGINTLLNIYEQRGDAFLKNLLNNYVIINKQLNGSFFGMSASQDGAMRFYKTGGEITQIDRILMKYYDRAIAQMESVSPNVKAGLPNNLMFGMEYFNVDGADENAGPQNCLTLSYIRILDNSSTAKYVHDKQILDKWADALGVNRPPILFSGYLDERQKTSVLDFVYTPGDQLLERFRAKSFTTHVLEILGAPLAEGDSIDEVVFRFYENEGNDENVTLAKMIDPVFAEILKRNEEGPRKIPNDYLYLIVIDLMNFIEMYNLKDLMSVTDKSNTFEENYISLIDKIYVDFIDKFKYKYLDVSLQLPEFMRRPEFDVNVDMIRSDKVKELISVCDTFKEIYKILLNFFRKKRNKPAGLFNSALVLQFNKLVDKIKNVVIGTDVLESHFPSFYEFTGSISEDFDYISTMSIKQRYEKYKKSQKVNIVVDYFQPVTNDHVNAAKLMKSKNGLPVVFVLINPGKRGGKFPFNAKTAKRMAGMVKSEYGDVIIDVVDIKANTVDSVVAALHPKYQPILWGAPKNRMNDYLLQLDFAKNKRVVYNISKNFKLMELPVNTNCQRVIDMIRNEKYKEYKEYVPKSIHSEFFNLKAEATDK
jgi:hypothetical protein